MSSLYARRRTEGEIIEELARRLRELTESPRINGAEVQGIAGQIRAGLPTIDNIVTVVQTRREEIRNK